MVFWAGWCGHCNAEAPAIVRIHQAHAAKLEVLGVSVDEHPEEASGFIRKHGVPYVNFIDSKLKIAERFGVKGAPVLILIAKGYAVDRAVVILLRAGLRHFVVNAGGDLTCRGRSGGKLWRVGIRHPRGEGENLAVLPVSNVSVATSGDYERFVEIDGTRYGHILDPGTGYPARGCRSVSIIAKKAYLADALATGVFVLGSAEGMKLVESMDGVEAMIVDARGGISVSSGLRGSPSDADMQHP